MTGLHRAFIGLGANLGTPEATIERAIADIDRLAATHVTARSSLYHSAPIGFASQPEFVNAVVRVETALAPLALLAALLALEHRHGRERWFPNAPRTLDLDLLLYDDLNRTTPRLTLPHPRMHERGFVLVPLLEIAPDIGIPGRGPAATLATALPDQGVRRA